MNNNGFESYSTYQPQPEAMTAAPGLLIRAHDTVYRTSSTDGSMSESSQANAQGHSGEMNPHHGDGSVFATARNPDGAPVLSIKSTTLVEMHGVQAPVSFWVSEGMLEQVADGSFREAAGQPQAAPLRISANVTDDFGNVTGLEPALELREEDCRFESNLAGLKAPRWLS